MLTGNVVKIHPKMNLIFNKVQYGYLLALSSSWLYCQ